MLGQISAISVNIPVYVADMHKNDIYEMICCICRAPITIYRSSGLISLDLEGSLMETMYRCQALCRSWTD